MQKVSAVHACILPCPQRKLSLRDRYYNFLPPSTDNLHLGHFCRYFEITQRSICLQILKVLQGKGFGILFCRIIRPALFSARLLSDRLIRISVKSGHWGNRSIKSA